MKGLGRHRPVPLGHKDVRGQPLFALQTSQRVSRRPASGGHSASRSSPCGCVAGPWPARPATIADRTTPTPTSRGDSACRDAWLGKHRIWLRFVGFALAILFLAGGIWILKQPQRQPARSSASSGHYEHQATAALPETVSKVLERCDETGSPQTLAFGHHEDRTHSDARL